MMRHNTKTCKAVLFTPQHCRSTLHSLSGRHAGLYQAGPQNRYFDLKAVTGWLVNSAFQSVVVFVMVMGTLTPLYADRHTGRTAGQWQTGATLFTAVIITVHLEISSVIDHWTWLHAFSVTFSVCK